MLPFHLIAIVHDERRLEAALAAADVVGSAGLGIMLRDAGHSPSRVRALAEHARTMPIPANVTLIANATAVDAIAFTHLTAAQVEVAQADAARAGSVQVGAARIRKPFGASAHSIEEARRACDLGASYILLSPIFPTPSKPGHAGIGIDELRCACEAIAVPAFALGGVDASNAARCIEAGAYGIAAISLFERERMEELRHVARLFGACALSDSFTGAGECT